VFFSLVDVVKFRFISVFISYGIQRILSEHRYNYDVGLLPIILLLLQLLMVAVVVSCLQ